MRSIQHIVRRMGHWEFWPPYITNIPVVGFWLWQAIKTKRLFFFSNVNPGTATSGMLGNSKMGILDAIPRKYLPLSFFSKSADPSTNRLSSIKSWIDKNNLSYPIIVKPDIGERGLNVARLDNESELDTYMAKANFDTIVQEYIDLPLEATVFVYRIPDAKEVGITSVCMKEFLYVQGDGKCTIRELIQEHPRGMMYEDVLESMWKDKWDDIPGLNEIVFLQPIGNHSKGTKFLNANHMIDDELTDTYSSILRQMNGFNYGRFDVRAKNWNSLKKGEGVRILEFNGVNSEPVHVYDPDYGTVNRYRDYYRHWALMARIHKAQMQKGIEPLKWSEAWQHLVNYRTYLKLVK